MNRGEFLLAEPPKIDPTPVADCFWAFSVAMHKRYKQKVEQSEYQQVPKDRYERPSGIEYDYLSYQVACFLARKYGSVLMDDINAYEYDATEVISYNPDGSYNLTTNSYNTDCISKTTRYSRMEDIPRYSTLHVNTFNTTFYRS